MKRVGYIYNDISSIDNCIEAAQNAVKGKEKRNAPGSISFDVSINKEYYGYMISEMLKNKEFVPSKPDHFFIEEGISQKRREIYAPKLVPDQLVHWAIMQQLAPIFMKSFYAYSCGNITGKGAEYIRKYLTKKLSFDNDRHKRVRSIYKYCLKLDIHHFFQSIDRDIMMEIVKSKIKDKDVINLVESIVMMPNTGTGLPIGFYTSQWLANLYLNKFDHWLVGVLGKAFDRDFIYVRYVDDMVIVGSNKRKLIKIKEQIINYLNKNLKLKLKYETNDQIFNIGKRPIDFVGFKFTYGKTTVRNKVFNRAIQAEKKLNSTEYNIRNLSSVISYDGYMDKANCYNAKRHIYKYGTGFYKGKLKALHHSPENVKTNAKRQAMIDIKTQFKNINEEEYYHGNISRIRFYRNDNGKFDMRKEIVAKIK